MKKYFVLLALMTSEVLTGCSTNLASGSTTTVVSGAAIVASAKPPAQKAEELAQGAEALLSAESLPEANDMVNLALQQDGSNLRARFLHALMAPALVERGVGIRVRPLVETDPFLLKSLDQQLAFAATDANFSRFLLDGQPDIATEENLQAHLDLLAQTLDDLRVFLKGITAAELTLHVPDAFLRTFTARYAHACQIKINAAYEYELTCPPVSVRHEVTLNQADFLILSDMATYYLLQLYAGDGFNLTGLIAKTSAQRQDPRLSGLDVYNALMKNSSFGEARKSGGLTKIRALGLDAVSSLQWAIANQSALCPTGASTESDRVGMLFNQGICLPPAAFTPFVAQIAKGLTGTAVPVNYTTSDQKVYKTDMNWTALVDHPLPNIHLLGALQFDDRGGLINVTEPTFGGTFPRGDANTILSLKDAGIENQ